jgi:allantoinase
VTPLPPPPGPTPRRPDLIIRGKRVVLPQGLQAAQIHTVGGKIAAIAHYDAPLPSSPLHDAGELIVMSGVVDTHVHINEPGRTDWEGFETATRAAAAGGVTTLIEMPLNSIPATTTAAAYQQKVAAAEGKLSADVGFWGGVVPGNARDITPLWDAGAFGFKCFLVPSGVAEFEGVAESDLREVLPVLRQLEAPLLVHAELPGPIDAATARLGPHASRREYANYLASRPRAAEDDAIAMLIRLAREFGVHIHIVHLSSSDSVAQIQAARVAGLPLTVETCPHYLTFKAEEIPAGATHFKCAPPIREAANREKLWAALADGTIDVIATDHSPCPPAMKLPTEGDFLRAWGGIASLQLALSIVWTQTRAGGYSVGRIWQSPVQSIARWLCEAPARLAGLSLRKGSIAVGCDADFAIWDPDRAFRVDAAALYHRHKITPYAGRELFGTVETTFLRGAKVFDRGEFAPQPHGRVLRRGAA